MVESDSNAARQIARAARSFQQQTTGRLPTSLAVILHEDTLIITLHGTFSPAEIALANSREGADQLREFRRQVFTTASDSLRQEIRRITGVYVQAATAEVETSTGTAVQMFSLAQAVPADTWSGSDPGPTGAEEDLNGRPE